MEDNGTKLNIIDISSVLVDAPVYPGDPVPSVKKIFDIEKGDDYSLTLLSTGLHAGTHIDAPSHYIRGAEGIDEIPLQTFIGPCRVVFVNEFVTGASIEQMYLYNCQRLILKGNGKSSLMAAAAEELVAAGVKLVGIDSQSISTGADQAAVHMTLLDGGCCVLEGLDLSGVDEPGDYFLFAAPVKVGGTEAAPARAVLIKDYLYWNK